MKHRIAIFASGSGSNAQKIIEHFQESDIAEVALVLSNNPEAYVLDRADNFEIPTQVINRADFYESNKTLDLLKNVNIDFIVLAGFLWLVPKKLIEAYPQKIVNIHPALLPKFGGKGMYGNHVHKAVMDAKEKETGITIHYVNEQFDEGEIVFQAKVEIGKRDTLNDIIFNVQQLEHAHFPKVIEGLLKKLD
jgi:phosphoribosylglycinamide formyltransferase 1